MLAVLEIIRCAAAVAFVVVLAMYVAYRWYESVKETAEATVKEELEQAIRETTRLVVKVEVEMKGKW
ncbi:hypothetical protein FFK04_07430 [Ruminococcus sp. KGMB03662]|nr:hypothetical protein FFK04_07430 [Ruminococcus sp. KGMB03662]